MPRSASLLCISIGLLSLCACGVDKAEYARVVDENARLSARVAELEVQVDELQHGAERLLAQAKADRERGDYESAASALENLIARHPETSQAMEGSALLSDVRARIEEARRREEEQRLMAEREREAATQRALASLVSSHDEVEGIDWYHDRVLESTTGSEVSLYMGRRGDGIPWLRFRIWHVYSTDRSWLFIRKYVFNVDGTKYEITPAHDEIERDNSAYIMHESYDAPPLPDHRELIEALIAGKRAILRCDGETRNDDRDITAQEKAGLLNVLTAYKSLGGKW